MSNDTNKGLTPPPKPLQQINEGLIPTPPPKPTSVNEGLTPPPKPIISKTNTQKKE